MIRTVITPTDRHISIEVPSSFVGRQVEIIAFMISDKIKEPIESDMTLTHYAAEKTLAKDWTTPEEDIAWQDL